MRILPGSNQTVAHESVTSRMLVDYGIKNPDFIPTIMRLWSEEESPLVQLLDVKGLKTKGLNFSTNDSNYRTVGSNHIQYAIEHADWRKFHWALGPSGFTFVCDAYPNEPGKNQSIIYAWADSNWAGYQETIEMADNKTQLYVLADPVEDDGNTWRYKLKIVTGELTDFVDPYLFNENFEAAAVMNMHEHDFSERGTEKYTFHGFGDAFLTLQRFKYSWSGTAKAMDKNGVSGKWVMHNGQKLFLSEAHERMMKMAAEYLNYQIIFGKTTVSQDTKKVILHNDQGREVMAGNGIMYANDGAINFPMQNGWTPKFIDGFLAEIDGYIRPGKDGYREVVVMAAPKSSMSFSQCLRDMGVTMNANIEGSGADKGINDTYKYYELDGIRVIVKRFAALSSNRRPGLTLDDGTRNNEWDAVVVPLGKTENGNNGIELVQLRPMASGTVAGIDESGRIATSVDGSSSHILFQNGVINRNQVFNIYRPYWTASRESMYVGRG